MRDKKRIAIVACALALPGEKGYTRFDFLANLLCEKGYDVDLYTSTFNHWEKKQRNSSDIKGIQNNTKYRIFLGYEPGYKKNVDIKRILSHLKLSKSILKILDEEHRKKGYDLIYCDIPDNKLAEKLTKFAKAEGIPVIVDVEDLWPEGMKLVFNVPVLSDILFYPFTKSAKNTYKNADAFVGTSDEFRDEPLKYFPDNDKPRKTVYVGCDLDTFDRGVYKNSDSIFKHKDEFWVIYTGTLGSSYDIPTLIRAAQKIKSIDNNIKIKILGGGPLENDFKNISKEFPCNVEFLGYQPYEKMAAYLVKSDVTINSFVKAAPQSIVNKIGDYLAAGKPMINTCSSQEFRKKVINDRFGINIWAEDVDSLTDAVMMLRQDKGRCKEMGENARKIAEQQFDRKVAYLEIINMISEAMH